MDPASKQRRSMVSAAESPGEEEITMEEAAKQLRVTKQMISKAIRKGRLQARRVPGEYRRGLLITLSSVKEYAKKWRKEE